MALYRVGARRGFTLIEVLIAIAILAIISAIVFPAFARARKSGFRTESISNLRQVGLAIELYRNDYDGKLAFRHLDPVVEARYMSAQRLLLSHGDAFDQGYGRTVSDCIDKIDPTRLDTSYETMLFSEAFYDRIKSVDPDAAIVVDRTHGEVSKEADRRCERLVFYYSGPILRLYEDTHVKIRRFNITSGYSPPFFEVRWSRAKLYTDAEMPPIAGP